MNAKKADKEERREALSEILLLLENYIVAVLRRAMLSDGEGDRKRTAEARAELIDAALELPMDD